MKKRIVLIISVVVFLVVSIVVGILIRNSVQPVSLIVHSLGAHYEGSTMSDGVYRMGLTVPVRNHTGRTLYYKVTADFREEYELGLIGERYLTDPDGEIGMHSIRPHETIVTRFYFETKAIKAGYANLYWRKEMPKLKVTVIEDPVIPKFDLSAFDFAAPDAEPEWQSPNKIEIPDPQATEGYSHAP